MPGSVRWGGGWLVEGGGTVASAGVGRVVVGVSGSLGNLAALHAAVEQARLRAAPLVAVLAWRPVGGELAYRRAPCAPLLRLWREQARDTLHTALVDAFGAAPHDIVLKALAVRGDAGHVLVVPPLELINEIRHGRFRLRDRDLRRAGLRAGTATVRRR